MEAVGWLGEGDLLGIVFFGGGYYCGCGGQEEGEDARLLGMGGKRNEQIYQVVTIELNDTPHQLSLTNSLIPFPLYLELATSTCILLIPDSYWFFLAVIVFLLVFLLSLLSCPVNLL